MMHITDLVREKGYEVIILNSNGNYWYDNRAWVIINPIINLDTAINFIYRTLPKYIVAGSQSFLVKTSFYLHMIKSNAMRFYYYRKW